MRIPADEAVFARAWEWVHERPWFYPLTGGRLSQEQYFARAVRRTQADFALWLAGELHSLITAELDAPGKFNLHITSCRRPDAAAVARAVYEVGRGFFRDLGAKHVYTYVPSFHFGSRKLVQMCGLRFVWRVKDAEIEFHGKPMLWDIYGMNRVEYLENHQNGRRR